nr:hypothetical protein Iba_chr15aCG12840 [Ipomoea batatas]
MVRAVSSKEYPVKTPISRVFLAFSSFRSIATIGPESGVERAFKKQQEINKPWSSQTQEERAMEPASQVGQPSECGVVDTAGGVVDTAGAWVSTWSAQIPLLMEFFIRDRRRSNCYKEEQRDICRVEQPPERSINDTAGAWVFTRDVAGNGLKSLVGASLLDHRPYGISARVPLAFVADAVYDFLPISWSNHQRAEPLRYRRGWVSICGARNLVLLELLIGVPTGVFLLHC